MEIILKRTCYACPEAYSAFYNDEEVAYLRLRHGTFRVTVGGRTVFLAEPQGDGIFEDDEREKYLRKAVKAIAKNIVTYKIDNEQYDFS